MMATSFIIQFCNTLWHSHFLYSDDTKVWTVTELFGAFIDLHG